jgi:L-ascorbate metabolism protein UlaG (beta-lactamase superfamily)
MQKPALLSLLLSSLLMLSGCTNYYQGPPSHHFDGKRFFMPNTPLPDKNLFDVMQWRLTSKRAEWPKSVPLTTQDRPPLRVTTNKMRISYIGHASFLVQTGNLNLLLDPVWSDRASPVSFAGPKRVTPPGMAMADLPPIDIVYISHNHYDHLDEKTLITLHENFKPRFITPLGNDHILKRFLPADAKIEAYDWGDVVTLPYNTTLTLAPMRHWSARGLFDRNKALWASAILKTPTRSLIFISDTGYGDGRIFKDIFAEHGAVDVAIIPIGAYEPRWFMKDAHVNPAEAVRIMEDLHAKKAIAHHFGSFQLTDEPHDQPVLDLKAALAQKPHLQNHFDVLAVGEAKLY